MKLGFPVSPIQMLPTRALVIDAFPLTNNRRLAQFYHNSMVSKQSLKDHIGCNWPYVSSD